MKKVLFGLNARKALKKGVDLCSDVAKVSLGGNGKNVAIFTGSKTEIINDGVSIIRAIDHKEPEIQAGVKLAIQCAGQTNKDAGDGTTTTIVLLQAFLKELITDFETLSPRKLREELTESADLLFSSIVPKEVKTREEMYNIALTASLNKNIATILSDGFHKLGKDAKVVLEESNKEEICGEIIDGLQFESRIATDDILSSLSEDNVTVEDVYVYVTEKVENIEQVQEALSKANDTKLVVIANIFDRQVLISFMASRGVKFYAIENKEMNGFEDLKEYGNNKMKAVITRESTTLIGGKVSKEYIEALRKKNDTEYEKDMTEKRLARLLSGVLRIEVGGKTDTEKEELYLKAEDASNALKKALISGYVPGGGQALKKASEILDTEGVDGMVKRVAQAPFDQIQKNSSNAEIPETAIDSFQTVKSSFYNALSTATSILTVEAALIEEPEEV